MNSTANGDLEGLRRLVTRALLVYLWLHAPFNLAVAVAVGSDWVAPTLIALGLAGVATLSWRIAGSGLSTRLIIAVALVGMGALLLFELANHPWQPDVHMYLFVALVMLAAFCDPRVLIMAAVAASLHLLIVNSLAPAAIYPGGADLGRAILHAAVIAMETVVLVWLTNRLIMCFRRAAEHEVNILRDAIDSISEGFVIYDAADRFVMCNAKFRELHPRLIDGNEVGMAFEDLVRKGVKAGRYPQAAGREEEWISQRVVRHRNPGAGVEQQLDDGRWLLITERRMKSGGIAGLRMDITALKKAEEALRRIQERYTLAVAGSDDGIWDWDVREDKVFYSPRMLEIIGFSPDRDDLSPAAWLDMIHADDLGRYGSSLVKYMKGEVDQLESEFRIRGDDGEYRWVVSRGKGVRDDTGQIVRLAGSVRDLTAQKEIAARRRRESEEFHRDLEAEICERGRAEETVKRANQQLSAIIGASPYAILGLDPQQSVMIWNRTAEALFGFSAFEVVGRQVPIFPDESAAGYQRLFEHASTGEFVRGVTLHARTRAGAFLSVNASAAAIHENDGELRMVVVTLEDVTRRIEMEEQLHQSQKMEALGRLTGGIAHDFNNMLGVVVGNLDMVLESAIADPDVLEMCGEALDASLLCTDLVGRLMSFSRKRPLQLASISLEAKLTGLVPMLRRTIGTNIEIATAIDERLWPIATDSSQLEAALINLAINARDAMPQGGRLTIEARNVDPEAADFAARYPGVAAVEYVGIRAGDSGIGMSADTIRHCLEPFFTTKGLTGGSGLGLSMVYGLVKQSHGHIRIDSELGVGTTIEMLFPHVAMDQSAPEPAASEDDLAVPGGNERILVVEDNAALRRTAVSSLTKLGYAVTEAENAASALDILSSGITIDLVFTDVVMPGRLNGVGLVREVQRRYPGVRVVFTSGYASSPEVELQIVESGHPLLAKPYRKTELATLLRAVLDAAPVYADMLPA